MAVIDVVSQVPHTTNYFSSLKATSSSARPIVRVGVRAKVGASARVSDRSEPQRRSYKASARPLLN
jgi:hypothetical protein